jgi:hypothetical protein
MGKKKFTSGFDSIFVEDKHKDDQHLDSSASNSKGNTAVMESGSPTIIKRAGSKNFTSDLDSLFQEAFTEAVEERFGSTKKNTGMEEDPFESSRTQYKKPLSGLDALIRQTVDSSLASIEHASIKRITFVFENQKIEKLKSIAKMERAFLKDIVNGVITEFIENYEKRKGRVA